MPNESVAPVTITFRIPGKWRNPGELIKQIPAEYRFTPEALIAPDGTSIEFDPRAPDDQFAQIFRSSCRQPATPAELAIVDSYAVNFCLSGPGGTMESALTMMRAGAALIQAGGGGVFIDNSGLAHGGQNWIDMAEDGSPDALSFAFVAIIGGRSEAFTMGMHALGLKDIVMKSADAQADEFGMIDVIRYMARSEKPVDDGHILMDLSGPRFKAFADSGGKDLVGSPMENPFGRLKLVSMKDLAETN